MIGDILTVRRKENILLLSSEVPLSQAKMESFIREVGKSIYGNSNWLLILTSESGKKALAIDLAKDRDYIKGWILEVASFMEMFCILEEIKIGKGENFAKQAVGSFLNRTSLNPPNKFNKVPDFYFTFENTQQWIDLTKKTGKNEDFIIREDRIGYNTFKKDLIDKGIIDSEFNLKVPVSVLNDYLTKYVKAFVEGNFNILYRVCPLCLEPIILLGKSIGRKTYCNNCNKHRKTITKKIKKIIKQDRRIKDKIEYFDRKSNPLKDYSMIKTYPKPYKEAIGFHFLMKYAKKIVPVEELNSHIEELRKWNELVRDLITIRKYKA